MNFRMRLLRPTFLALLSLLLISPPSVAENQQVLTFGVVPQQAAKKLAKKWGPLFQYIGERAGVTIRFKNSSKHSRV